jgi:hypothetical protein
MTNEREERAYSNNVLVEKLLPSRACLLVGSQ